jgi:hypothetical protein
MPEFTDKEYDDDDDDEDDDEDDDDDEEEEEEEEEEEAEEEDQEVLDEGNADGADAVDDAGVCEGDGGNVECV